MEHSGKEFISTGVSPLDQILEGLLIGDNVVWYDDAGSLASVFSMNFLKASMAEGKSFIYVSFDRSPRNLLEKLGPLAENEKLTILDCFTYGKGKSADTFLEFYKTLCHKWPCRIMQVLDPYEPEHVMQTFLDVQADMEAEIRFVFESLTGMQELWEGEDAISRFYSHTCPRLYELNTIGYWIIEKDAHSKRLKAMINQVAQVVVELSLKRGRNSLTVIKAEKRDLENLNTPHWYSTKGLTVSFASKRIFSEQIDLGKRIKDHRSMRGLSQTEIARLIGVTPSNISQIENNLIYPSLPALLKIAEVLTVDVTQLLSKMPVSHKQTVYSEFIGGEIHLPNVSLKSASIRQKLPSDASSYVELYLIEIFPGKEIPSHFFMHKAEEFGYVLDGKVEMTVKGEIHTARTGDMIHLTAEIPSRWRNPQSHEARLLWVKIKQPLRI